MYKQMKYTTMLAQYCTNPAHTQYHIGKIVSCLAVWKL